MKKIMTRGALFVLCFSASSALAVTFTIQEQLGRHLYLDKDLSWNSTQSCATCHHKSSGFADPTNSRDPENVMNSLGDDGISRGGRNAPTSAYAGYSPILNNDSGEWIGGMFWDGRMTGDVLGDPLAEQAQGPPLNPVEMNMPDLESVVARVAASRYANLFIDTYGADFFDDPLWAWDEMARLIATYERSVELNPFNSRFDRGELTGMEARGFAAFKKAECNSCHSLTIPADAPGPVFTTYGYANIGVPNNAVVNPDPDLGLGYVIPGEDGKFKIPTLRNVAATAPYSHNGYFSTLEAMVNFHVNRGVLTPDVTTNLVDPVTVPLSAQEISDIVAFLGALTDI